MHGIIKISAKLEYKKEKTLLEVSVKDRGIGMTPEEERRVFQPFSRQTQNQARNYMSNGVGLSICKQICDQFEGKIKVNSVLGIGSTFTFSMRVFPMLNQNSYKFAQNEAKPTVKQSYAHQQTLLIQKEQPKEGKQE